MFSASMSFGLPKEIEALRRSDGPDLADILGTGRHQGGLSVPVREVTAPAIIAMLTGLTTWYRATGSTSPATVETVCWRLVAGMTGPGNVPTDDAARPVAA